MTKAPFPTSASAGQSFMQWRKDQTLAQAMASVEAQVRINPQDTQPRWLLFELLCVTRQWERALKQVQTCARLKPDWTPLAQLMRGLIQAERQREEVFAGQLQPVPVTALHAWMASLATAIGHNRRGEHALADAVRVQALDEAEKYGELGGTAQRRDAVAAHDGGAGANVPFDWFCDSDTRLGPICEFIASGSYRWVALADVASLEFTAPSGLLDLVWLPATLRLKDPAYAATPLKGFVPTRYPAWPSGAIGLGAGPDAASSDALQLSRLTVWSDVGDSGVFGQGQKTFLCSAGDWPLLELAQLQFHTPQTPKTGPEEEDA